MSAVQTLLADSITAVINTAQTANALGALSFTARRSYPDWDDDFKDLKAISVDVVFASSESISGEMNQLDSAGSYDKDPAIDIAVRYRFKPTERELDGRLKNSAVDILVELIEKIHELLSGDRQTAIDLGSGIAANWIDTIVRTYCDYGRLRQGVFLGVVRVRYNVSKPI